MSTEGVRVYFCTETGLIDAVRWHGDYGCCHDITDQLAKRDEEIARRAFLAARDGLEECSKCGNHTVFDYDSPENYINSEEFKKVIK